MNDYADLDEKLCELFKVENGKSLSLDFKNVKVVVNKFYSLIEKLDVGSNDISLIIESIAKIAMEKKLKLDRDINYEIFEPYLVRNVEFNEKLPLLSGVLESLAPNKAFLEFVKFSITNGETQRYKKNINIETYRAMNVFLDKENDWTKLDTVVSARNIVEMALIGNSLANNSCQEDYLKSLKRTVSVILEKDIANPFAILNDLDVNSEKSQALFLQKFKESSAKKYYRAMLSVIMPLYYLVREPGTSIDRDSEEPLWKMERDALNVLSVVRKLPPINGTNLLFEACVDLQVFVKHVISAEIYKDSEILNILFPNEEEVLAVDENSVSSHILTAMRYKDLEGTVMPSQYIKANGETVNVNKLFSVDVDAQKIVQLHKKFFADLNAAKTRDIYSELIDTIPDGLKEDVSISLITTKEDEYVFMKFETTNGIKVDVEDSYPKKEEVLKLFKETFEKLIYEKADSTQLCQEVGIKLDELLMKKDLQDINGNVVSEKKRPAMKF